tara:strand:+ start:2514 stop:2789 length:276 start_codon:yes stop_codon:yes gene_type:complete
MEDGLKKKLMAVGAAVLGALVFGESQVMDMEERLAALEGLHPELVTSVPKDTEESPPALGKPGMSAPPIEAPVEESSDEPVEEVSEEVEEG